MQQRPFSICFDESTVNKTSQLNINVSVIGDEGRIHKGNFATLEIKEGEIYDHNI